MVTKIETAHFHIFSIPYIAITLFLLFSFSPTLVNAQYAQSFYRVQHITTEQGLSQNFIECMFQDSRGFIWAGTQDGLNLYDGYKFTVFRSDLRNKNSISNNFVHGIVEDQDHNMWFATRGGLNKYDFAKNRFEVFHADKDGIPEDYLLDLFIDSNNTLWIATQNEGLAFCELINGKLGKMTRLNMQNSILATNKINNFSEDKKGFIWISTMRGVYRYDPVRKTVTDFASITSQMNKFVSVDFCCAFEDSKGAHWFATQLGLYSWNPKKDEIRAYGQTIGGADGLLSDVFLDIKEDRFQNILVASYNSLAVYNRTTDSFDLFPVGKDDYSLNNEFLSCILLDREGVVWVGTEKGGLNKYNNYQKKFRSITYSAKGNGLNANMVNAIAETNNKLLIGTVGGGLNVFDRATKKFSYFKHDVNNPKSICWDVVSNLLCDDQNRVWVASWGGGLSLMTPKKPNEFKTFKFSVTDVNTISDDRVSSLYYLKKQKLLLVGTFVGLSIIDTENYTVHRFEGSANGTKLVSVSAILLDSKDRLWIGTTEGLFMLPLTDKTTKADIINAKKLYRYVHDEKDTLSLGSNFITTIVEDSDQQIWIAVHGSGLDRLEDVSPSKIKLSNFSLNEGLCNGVIYSVVEDSKKYLWLSTDNGLSRFDRNSKTFSNYYTYDGLRSNQFYWSAHLLDKDGNIYFGSVEGICVFNPNEIQEIDIRPKLAFTDFKLFNKSVVPNSGNPWLQSHINSMKELILDYADNVFSFEFTALSYILPERNAYAYKMENFESEWNYTSSERRYASYTNLNPGTYIFRVKAANATGVWNNEGISIKIIVKPPFWLTWWFILISFVTIIGGAFSFYRYRVYQLKKQKAILENKVAIRTQELSLANGELLEKQEEIMQQQEEILSQRDELFTKNKEMAETNMQINQQNIQINQQKENIQKAFSNIELLSEFGKRITSELDIEELESIIYEYVGKLMDTTAFGIGRFNEKRNKIEFLRFIERGEIIPFFDKDINDEVSLAVKCFNTKQILLKNSSDSTYFNYLKTLPEMKHRLIPQSAVHVPLVIDNRSVGVIVVNSESKNAYNETDAFNLQTLASYIAVALDNAAAYRMLNSKSEAINGSIRYGLNIQKAILPSVSLFMDFEQFVIFKPRDIVSGDFYWAQSVHSNGRNILFTAVVDCTGHGVPGAFMSLIASRLLDEIVIQEGIHEPDLILSRLDIKVQRALNQEETGNVDGMDLCICAFLHDANGDICEIWYAGAKRPLFIFRSTRNEIEVIPADRHYIGRSKNQHIDKVFTPHKIDYTSGDVIYLSSDGFVDQNGPSRSKFGTPRLLGLLAKFGAEPLYVQQTALTSAIESFMNLEDQRDDITIMGLKILNYSEKDVLNSNIE